MNEELINIMWDSFHEQFYVDKRNAADNKQYLKALTQKIIEQFPETLSDYSRLAEFIVLYDNKIKLMYLAKNPIFIKVLSESDEIPFGDIYKRNISHLSDEDNDLINTYLFYHNSEKTIPVLRIFHDFKQLTPSDRELVVNGIQHVINQDPYKNQYYRVSKMDNNWEKDLFIQIAIRFLGKNRRLVFNHQTIHSIQLFEHYDRTNMYLHMYANAPRLRKLISFDDEGLECASRVLNTHFYVFSSCNSFWDELENNIQRGDPSTASYFLATLLHDKIISIENTKKHQILLDNIIQNEQSSKKRENSLLDRISHLEKQINKLQLDNSYLERKISDLQKQSSKNEVEKKELYSLREYIFTKKMLKARICFYIIISKNSKSKMN